MGRNVDLCSMLGLPEQMECPKCGKSSDQRFRDYDIDSNANPKPGMWQLHCFCEECGHSWQYQFEIARKPLCGDQSPKELTAYCVDVSESVDDESFQFAVSFVKKNMAPGDVLIAFDNQAKVVSTLSLSPRLGPISVGGFNVEPALELAKKHGCSKTVLLSDGLVPDEDIARFDTFVHI